MLSQLIHAFGAVFLAFSWLAYDHYPPWVNFHSEFLAFFSLYLLLGSLLRAKTRLFAFPKIAISIACLAALPWLQYATGLVFFGGDAFVTTAYLLGMTTAIGIAYSSVFNTSQASASTWFLLPVHALLWAALLSAMMALLQWLSLTDSMTTYVMHTEPGDRVLANLGQPNQLASLLLMGLVSLTYLYEQRQLGRFSLILGGIFVTWAIVLTESRTALLGAVFISLFWAYKFHSAENRLPKKYVLIWLIGLGIGKFMLPTITNLLLMSDPRITSITVDSGRAEIWWQAIYALRDAPWFGYGWNQTPVAQSVGALSHPGTLTYTYAHNVVLDLLLWVGLPLGLILTSLCGYWFITRTQRVKTLEAIYAMAILLPIVTHSMFEFPFAYAYFLLTAGLLIGVIEASMPISIHHVIPNKLVLAYAMTAAVVGSYFAYEYLLIEEDYRVARFENLKVGHTPPDYQRPSIYVNTQMSALLTVLRQPASPNMLPAQLESLRKVSLRFGYRPLVYRYALALGLNGNIAGARHQMLVFRSMFGELSYNEMKAQMLLQAATIYPQLNAVQLP